MDIDAIFVRGPATAFDYIIAGAGSTGCAIAARLCEYPDISICLIEAGGDGNSLFVRMPAGENRRSNSMNQRQKTTVISIGRCNT